MKSSRLWAQDVFQSVRGRPPGASEADRWVVDQIALFIARAKREAFAAGTGRRHRDRSLQPGLSELPDPQPPERQTGRSAR